MANSKVYEVITDKVATRIKNAIDNGTSFQWVKPWKGYPLGNYTNYLKDGVDGMKEYRGINRLLLDSGLYITMKQLNELEEKDNKKYKIKKGCHRECVYFYKKREVDKKDEDGNVMLDENGEPIKQRFMIIRFYPVFNVADIEGLDEVVIEGIDTEYDETKLSKKADKIVTAYCKRSGVALQKKKGIDKAYHNAATHTVVVPDKKQFNSLEEYYSTLFHELTHSTQDACGRVTDHKKGSKKYSFEELVAELGALFLMQEIGFDTSKTEINSTAYLKGWLKVLESDVSFIVKASTQAQKALDYILDVKYENTEDTTEVEIEIDDEFDVA